MRKLLLLSSLVLLSASQVFADGNSATEQPNYQVNKTATAPVIDGVISPGEWADAAPGAGDWVDLRVHTPDIQNLSFQMLWDDDGLYLVGSSVYDAIPAPMGVEINEDDFEFEIETAPANPNWNGNAQSYNPNLYFDPNTDGEDIFSGAGRPGNETDGYQIAWDIREGFAARRPTEGDPDRSLRDPRDADGNQINDYFYGTFLEAHVESAFGNAGLLDTSNEGPNLNYRDDTNPGWTFAQNASSTDVNGTGVGGSVWEVAFTWDFFNASNPNKLVTEAEAESRGPEFVIDDREFLTIPIPEDHPDYDPEFPDDMIDIENPDFNVEAKNVGQIPGTAAFIGNPGEPDLRFSDPESGVFLDNGLYAVDGPAPGDRWGFEIGLISQIDAGQGLGGLPSWSEPLDGDPGRSGFAPNGQIGHGIITFADGAAVGCDPNSLGDLDGDGQVGFPDFLILSANFGSETATHADGDIDCDGSVGFPDFLVLSANFGSAVGAEAAASVPEPSGFALLSFAGLLGAMLRRRR